MTKDQLKTAFLVDMLDPAYRARQEISNSGLSLLQSSPKGFKGVKDGEMEGFSSSGFKIGTALDILILTPDKFDEIYIGEPFDMQKPTSEQEKSFCSMVINGATGSEAIRENYVVGKKTDEQIDKMAVDKLDKFDVYFDFEKQLASGKSSYSTKDYEQLMLMKIAIREHEKASQILFEEIEGVKSFSQVAIFWEMEKTNCKALLDRLLINKETKTISYYDLKFSGKGVGFFENSFEQYRYYRQLGFYASGLQKLFPDFKIEVFIIAVTPKWEGECRVLQPGTGWIGKGIQEYKDLLKRFNWHTKEDKWDHRMEYYLNDGIEVINYV